MGDITKNFSYSEYRPKGSPKTWMPESDYQQRLIDNHASNLQVVRNELPDGCYMKITSGVRTESDFDRLIAKGYHPSATSDHYCGNIVPISEYSSKYKKYGPLYMFSVGAADVEPFGIKVYDLFKLSVKLTREGKCDFGQVIYEKDPITGKEWVHYGASIKDIFSSSIVRFIDRTQFMQSLDGGKTYSVVTNP